MKMNKILTEWRKFLNERVKPSEFYPPEFDNFLKLIKDHEDKPWIFFDTETTGLRYKDPHVQVTQIACVVYNIEGITEGKEPTKEEEFNVKVELTDETKAKIAQQRKEVEAGTFEDKKTIEDILGDNYYYDDDLKPMPLLKAVKLFDNFLNQIREKSPSGEFVMIAQNSPFDVGIINTAYERLNLTVPDDELWDTKGPLDLYLVPIIKMIKNDPEASETDKKISNLLSKSNGSISTSLGIVVKAFDLEDKGWHNALADVQMTMDMLFAVLNYVKEKQGSYKPDLSTVKPFDPIAGDPYSPKRSG